MRAPWQLATLVSMLGAGSAQATPHNMVIFVADGLRAGSVTRADAPTLQALSRQGVWFRNSHAVVPTLTTTNAASIATGRLPGDSGDFANTLYPGYRVFQSGNFAHDPASLTPFIESDIVLGDLDDHYGGNWLGVDSLLARARAAGFATAAIGKQGPVALQDVSQLAPHDAHFAVPATLILDDATGSSEGVPLDPALASALRSAGLPTITPTRVQPVGDAHTPGTLNPNAGQQAYYLEATARVVLPWLRRSDRPFVLIYWSRDPDITQHAQGDSLNHLSPGINGRTSRAAVRNADENLRQLLQALRADRQLAGHTDVLVTSDHGFATIAKSAVDERRTPTRSPAAHRPYVDVPAGFLPPGFLAMDLAEHLGLPLFDADATYADAQGHRHHRPIRLGGTPEPEAREHPQLGNGLLGGGGSGEGDTDAELIVTANGGSDLIYVTRHDAALVARAVSFLTAQDYTDAVFVADEYGPLPGALPMSAIGLIGAARLPTPAIVVGFRSFTLPRSEAAGIDNPLQRVALIADTPLQQGQGMHGSFGRDNTANFMAAVGPDFKEHYVDAAPVGNADLAPTVLSLLGLASTVPQSQARESLSGRVVAEALRGATTTMAYERCRVASAPAAGGARTWLEYQQLGGEHYVDSARMAAVPPREPDATRPVCRAEQAR